MALTVDGGNSIRVARHFGLHSTPSLTFVQANNLVALKGSPVRLTSGKIDDLASAAAADQTNLFGITEEDGDNDTNGADIRVVPLMQGLVFSAHISNALTDRATLQTDIGTAYGLNQDAVNLGWYIDSNRTAVLDTTVRVIGFQDPVGTTNGRVYFTFLDYVMDTNAGLGAQVKIVNGYSIYAAAA